MNKKLSFYLTIFLLVYCFCSCKKEKPIENKINGSWELKKITFIDTDTSLPLDSFRNVFNVNLDLNYDFSFKEVEDIGEVFLGPLGSIGLIENYNPRNAKARYLIYGNTKQNMSNSRSFSIEKDLIVFKLKSETQNSSSEEKYIRKFILKNNNELDIERLDFIVFNREKGVTLPFKVKFSYHRK